MQNYKFNRPIDGGWEGGVYPPDGNNKKSSGYRQLSAPTNVYYKSISKRAKRRARHLPYIYQKVFINLITEDQLHNEPWYERAIDHKRYIKQKKNRQRTNIGLLKQSDYIILLAELLAKRNPEQLFMSKWTHDPPKDSPKGTNSWSEFFSLFD